MSAGNDQKKKDSKYIRLFHYTNNDGIRGITSQGKIDESTDTKNDAAYGTGAYATTKGPNHSKSTIAYNNFDGVARKQEALGKVDHCVEFKVPISNVKQAPSSDRDIYVHKGPIDLKEAKDVKIHIRQGDGKTMKSYTLKKD